MNKKVELIKADELNVYFVKPHFDKQNQKEENKIGNKIVFINIDGTEEFILGLSEYPPENKLWLEYLCLRLNRAFINGWFASKGIISYPDNEYYNILNELFKKITGNQ